MNGPRMSPTAARLMTDAWTRTPGGVAEGLLLNNSERLIATFDASLHEARRGRTRRVTNWGGVRVPIFGHVSGTLGQSRGTSQTEPDRLQQIDAGRFLVTNERGVFLGPLANRQMPWNRLVSINVNPSAGLLVLALSGRERSICLRLHPAVLGDVAEIIAALQSGWQPTTRHAPPISASGPRGPLAPQVSAARPNRPIIRLKRSPGP